MILRDTQSIITKLPSSSLVKKAIDLILKTHAGEMRKDGTEPVVNHPLRTALSLYAIAAPEELVLTALLHDILEDSDTPADMLSREFGEVIKTQVLHVTDENKSMNNKERLKAKIKKLEVLPEELLWVKCADIADNLATIVDYAKEHHRQFPWKIFHYSPTEKIEAWNRTRQIFTHRIPKFPLLKNYCESLTYVKGLAEKAAD